MTSKAGHTAGPWETDNSWSLHGEARPDMMDYRCNVDAPVPFIENEHGGFERVETQTGAIAFGRTPGEAQANARLIAEAGTIAHETGLTPRQLADRCEKLEEAAKELLSYATLDGLLDKVESGAEHPNYVFSVSLGDLLKLRAALAKATSGKLTDDEIVELTSREAALGPDRAGGA